MEKDLLLNLSLYEKMDMMDPAFPVMLHLNKLRKEKHNSFFNHWHEKIEFLYFVKGEGVIICNTNQIAVNPGVLVVINSNELHQGYSITDSLEYYCLIVDNSLFQSGCIGICETKYTNPIYNNHILFKNKIDNNIEINACMDNIIEEYKTKSIGFELSVKSYLCRLLVLLLRNYTNLVLTPYKYNIRVRSLDKLNSILVFIEKSFYEEITIDKLCLKVNLSRYYFCHLFKAITGKSVSTYVNSVRINKAEIMLRSSNVNVTETAMACGFNDSNYFCRLFKKYKNKTPSQVIKGIKKASHSKDRGEKLSDIIIKD